MNQDDIYYQIIKGHYQEVKASGSSCMNCIDEGLFILKELGAQISTQQAFCVHPLFSDDNLLENFYGIILNHYRNFDPCVAILGMEYRFINRSFLPSDVTSESKSEDIKKSPLVGVNQMLIATKIQDRKRFIKSQKNVSIRHKELEAYYDIWFDRLDISESLYIDIASGMGKR